MIHKHIHRALKHTFIPHKENDYRPHFLREHVVLTIVAISILALLFSVTTYLLIRKTTFGTLVASSVLIDFTNDTRLEYGLSPVYKNDQLQQSSMAKAQEMSTLHYFSHTSPDGSAPWKFFQEAKYVYAFAGENLALNFETSKQVHTGWLNSPKHKDNIIDPRFKEIGISVLPSTYNQKPVLFVVQHFGNPTTPILTKERVYYSSLLERLIFNSPRYVERAYIVLILMTLLATIFMLVIEVETRHTRHIVYGVLMLIILILCSFINAELLT